MAELEVEFDKALKISTLDVGALADAEELFADADGVDLVAGRLEVDVVGEDLTYAPGGELEGGTVTDLFVFDDDETWFTLTDAEVAVPDMLAAIADDDPLAFAELFLGGDDTVTGGDLGDELFGFSGDDALFGGEGNDVLDGGDGDDTLDGELGADRMIGGDGDDTFLVDDVRDRVVEAPGEGTDRILAEVSLALPEEVEELELDGVEDLAGTGNDGDNLLIGNAGDNRLDGAAGADTLEGGDGDDTYLVDDAGDAVVEEPDGGTDTVLATVSFALPENVETLVLVGRGEIDGTGNDADNEILGNARANTLDGGGGADTLRGGAGNDTYVIDAEDTIVEERGGGFDRVQVDGDHTLGLGLEALELLGDGDHAGTGNLLANLLLGNDGANLLDGKAGNDRIEGGAGDDELLGGVGNDILVGGAGDDLLRGGSGRDRLAGGDGADGFVVGDGPRDRSLITDFDTAEGDRVLIGDLLSGLADDADLSSYLKLAAKGRATAVFVDADGAGGGKAVQVAVVQGDLGTDLASLLADGTIDRA